MSSRTPLVTSNQKNVKLLQKELKGISHGQRRGKDAVGRQEMTGT